jgi:predicted lipoprotein with Yx(FWY)xxD motif
MRMTVRTLTPCAAAAAAAVAAALAIVTVASASPGAAQPPVTTISVAPFGKVLATRGRKALYWWNVEKRDFRVHCTGGCARAWPPLIVTSRSAVPRKVAGVRGTFGVIRRPDGRLQVTWNRLPVYTYAHEGPRQVLCDNVDGWFVVRV